MIPELLRLNHVIATDDRGAIAFELISHKPDMIEIASQATRWWQQDGGNKMVKSLTPKLKSLLKPMDLAPASHLHRGQSASL